jgi:hypothetical protein
MSKFDTLLPKGEEILGSTSPLSLDPLRYLAQRWFSPQALTFRVPLGSWIFQILFDLNSVSPSSHEDFTYSWEGTRTME